MNVLILVLSAKREPWGSLMDCQMETWDKEPNPQTHTLYYRGKMSDQERIDLGNVVRHEMIKVFYSPQLDESLEEISRRTIEAFDYALKLHPLFEWDFLARPHSSTYVHKGNLVKFCETLPPTNVLCGVMTGGEKPFIWGGCHYLFSRDVIERFVEHKDKWNRSIMEDGSISQMAEELGIPVTPGLSSTINIQDDGSYLCLTYNHGESFTFTDFEDVNKLDGHFFVRVKHDPDRTQDLRIMRELHKHWK